jgi:hypothetical protein
MCDIWKMYKIRISRFCWSYRACIRDLCTEHIWALPRLSVLRARLASDWDLAMLYLSFELEDQSKTTSCKQSEIFRRYDATWASAPFFQGLMLVQTLRNAVSYNLGFRVSMAAPKLLLFSSRYLYLNELKLGWKWRSGTACRKSHSCSLLFQAFRGTHIPHRKARSLMFRYWATLWPNRYEVWKSVEFQLSDYRI